MALRMELAMVEESVVSTLFDVFSEKKELDTPSLLKSLRGTVPLSKTMSEDMEKLRNWSEGRTRLATSPELSKELESDKRRLEI